MLFNSNILINFDKKYIMEDLEKVMMGWARMFDNFMNEIYYSLFDEHNLTHQQLQYLKVIIKLENPTISQIAKELKISKPSVTSLLDSLETKKYVRRVSSDRDKRSLHVHLDICGELVKKNLDNVYLNAINRIHERLNDTETIILMTLLKKVIR